MITLLRRSHFILLAGIAATLTFNLSFSFTGLKLNNVFIVLTAFNSLVFFIGSKERPKYRLGLMTCLFIGLYLLYVIGLIQTDNLKQGIFELEKKAGIILFPLIFYLTPILPANQIRRVLLIFCISCVLTGLVCILVATYRYFSFKDIKFFFYHDLSGIVGMHAVYLSMYCCFAISILLYFNLSATNLLLKRKFFVVLVVVFLATLIFLLAGRTHIFLLILGTVGYFTYHFSKKHNLTMALVKAGAIGVIILGIALIFPTNRERFKQAINYKGQYVLSGEWGEQQMRPLIWACVLETFKEAPLFGIGTGDVQDDLQVCYRKRDYVSLLIWEPVKFNAHNEFFEITLGLGLTGLVFFLASLAVSIRCALRDKNILHFAFLIIFIVSCITESLLQRHNGIVFYSFFNSFLFFHSKNLPLSLARKG